jgi:hypothetical protein
VVHPNCDGGEETVAFFLDEGSVFFALHPRCILIVAKCNNPTCCSDGVAKLVRLDGLDTHKWEDRDVWIFRQPNGFSDTVIGVIVDEALMLLDV